MAIEVNAHQIENFALKPASAKPNRNERVNVRLSAGNAGAQANLGLLGNRSEVIVQFEPRFNGEAINAGGVGEKVELQGVATFLCGGAQQAVRDHNCCLTVKLDHFFHGFCIPGTQMFDDNISALIGIVRHSFSLTRSSLFVPVQRALFPEIEVTDKQNRDVYHHFHEAVQTEIPEDEGPWIKKNRFDIEQDKNHCNQVKFYREGFTRVAGRLHATFVRLEFGFAWAPPADDF